MGRKANKLGGWALELSCKFFPHVKEIANSLHSCALDFKIDIFKGGIPSCRHPRLSEKGDKAS